MQTMVWNERTRMNQIDERVGLQAVLTRMLSSLLWGGLFEGEKKKRLSPLLYFCGVCVWLSGSGVCVMDGFEWNGRWLKGLLLWFYRLDGCA
jgi:hypothetical protein